MATFVLIHSPLVGPTTWRLVGEELRASGNAPVIPSLAGCEAPYWRAHVRRVVEAAHASGHESIVLVAHSGAGPLLPLVAAAFDGGVDSCVYVDAMLPTHGRSRLSVLPPAIVRDAFLPADDATWAPWGSGWPESAWERLLPDAEIRHAFRSELTAKPVAIYEEPLPDAPEPPRSAYLQFSGAYDEEAAAARTSGWPIARVQGRHLHMLVDPGAVAAALIALSRT